MKVALSGVGGDELFQGYGHFRTIPPLVRWARRGSALPGGDAVLEAVAKAQARRTGNAKWRSAPRELRSLAGALRLRRGLFAPDLLPELMGPERARLAVVRAQETPDELALSNIGPARALSYLETTGYLRNQLLRDADWTSMAHGVELRTPLCDIDLLHTLAPYLEQLGSRPAKLLLAEAADLPPLIAQRPKVGFAVPVTTWLGELGRVSSAHPTQGWAKVIGAAFA